MIIRYPGDILPDNDSSIEIIPENIPVDLKQRVVNYIGEDVSKFEEVKLHLLEILNYYNSQNLPPFAKTTFKNIVPRWIKPIEQYESWEDLHISIYSASARIEYAIYITETFEVAFKTQSSLHPTVLDHLSEVLNSMNTIFSDELIWIFQNLDSRMQIISFQIRLAEVINNIKSSEKVEIDSIDDSQMSEISNLNSQIQVFITLLDRAKDSNNYNLSKAILESAKRMHPLLQKFCINYIDKETGVDIPEHWIQTIYLVGLFEHENDFDTLIDSYIQTVKLFDQNDENDVKALFSILKLLQNHSHFAKVLQMYTVFAAFDVVKEKRLENIRAIIQAVSESTYEERISFVNLIFAFWTVLEGDEIEFLVKELENDSDNHLLVEKLKELDDEYNGEEDDEETDDLDEEVD